MSGCFKSGGGEDVDDLAFGGDGLGDQLPDGVHRVASGVLRVAALSCSSAAWTAWKKPMSSRISMASSLPAQRAKACESSVTT